MTPTTLQALRRLLFFSTTEAAALLGADAERPQGITERSWRYWESGERPVPDAVAATVLRLCAWRGKAIETAERAIADAVAASHGEQPAEVVLVWYVSLDDWLTLNDRDALLWRPQCSVIAQLAGAHADVVRIRPFDAPAYAAWLGRRRDGEGMRSQWAAGAAP